MVTFRTFGFPTWQIGFHTWPPWQVRSDRPRYYSDSPYGDPFWQGGLHYRFGRHFGRLAYGRPFARFAPSVRDFFLNDTRDAAVAGQMAYNDWLEAQPLPPPIVPRSAQQAEGADTVEGPSGTQQPGTRQVSGEKTEPLSVEARFERFSHKVFDDGKDPAASSAIFTESELRAIMLAEDEGRAPHGQHQSLAQLFKGAHKIVKDDTSRKWFLYHDKRLDEGSPSAEERTRRMAINWLGEGAQETEDREVGQRIANNASRFLEDQPRDAKEAAPFVDAFLQRFGDLAPGVFEMIYDETVSRAGAAGGDLPVTPKEDKITEAVKGLGYDESIANGLAPHLKDLPAHRWETIRGQLEAMAEKARKGGLQTQFQAAAGLYLRELLGIKDEKELKKVSSYAVRATRKPIENNFGQFATAAAEWKRRTDAGESLEPKADPLIAVAKDALQKKGYPPVVARKILKQIRAAYRGRTITPELVRQAIASLPPPKP
ncbi:MAG: hypothetical protein HYV03_04385 [Deltaproteobacteria bacterium]|nr:hypothetical protein [Deltaproteobacteria bacterium]